MALKELTFYEFTGVVVPGSLTSMGLAQVFDLPSAFVPSTVGELGAHLIVAYGLGHLVQGFGNAVEAIYWKLRGGMPTDWPRSAKNRRRWPGAFEALTSVV